MGFGVLLGGVWGWKLKFSLSIINKQQKKTPTLPPSNSEWIPQELVSEETIIKNSFEKYPSYGLWIEKHF